jgi:hypothetical protein
MKGVALDVVALLAQGAAFIAGLIVSLLVGMYLAAHLDGPGGLLIATVISGAGLLGAAVASQSLRDYLVRREG